MVKPSTPARRVLVILCLASASWAFTFGLGAPLASFWLRDHGCSDTTIGLNTGAHYLGIIVTALLVPRLVRRWGRGCIVAGMLVSGWTVTLFPWVSTLAGWHLLRFLDGVAGALSVIPTETILNQHSSPTHRARNFGVYALCVAFGLAVGNFVGLQLYGAWPYAAFAGGGLAGAVAGGLILFGIAQCKVVRAECPPPRTLARGRNVLSFGSAWCQGFLEGALIAFLSLYLLFLGLSETRVSWLTSGIMVGVMAVQLPLAWLADRLGRTTTLVGCYVVTGLGLSFLPFCTDSGWLTFWLFCVGACSSACYPLGLALLGEHVPDAGLAHANAWYLMSNCLGSLTGPVAAGVAMDHFGKSALFAACTASVFLVIICWAGSHLRVFQPTSMAVKLADFSPPVEKREVA
jgi:MFS family permease